MDSPPVPAGTRDPVLPSGVHPLAPDDPKVIGGLSLVGRLGAGGMGRVYLGRERGGGLVAVKVAHAGAPGSPDEIRARFRAEVDCLSRVPADCTVRLLGDGVDGAPPYIVTEYLAGRSLKDVIEHDGPLPPEQVRALATGVVRALTAIHRAGLIHRDLKPANVVLTPMGPRVIDFGIAQQVSGSGGTTAAGTVVGSVGWIAPERLTHRPATPASDVFCWGCLVAYAGLGRNPFGAGDAEDVARRAVLEAPDLDGLDDSLRPLVAAALAKDPADRPVAEDLLARLDLTTLTGAGTPAVPGEDAGAPPSPCSETAVAPIPRTRPRRKALPLAVAASAVVALAAAGTTWLTALGGPAAPHADQGTSVEQKSPGSVTDTAVISRRTASTGTRTRTPATAAPASGHSDKQPGDRGKGGGDKGGGGGKGGGKQRGHGKKPHG